jgi:hypothetical protein
MKTFAGAAPLARRGRRDDRQRSVSVSAGRAAPRRAKELLTLGPLARLARIALPRARKIMMARSDCAKDLRAKGAATAVIAGSGCAKGLPGERFSQPFTGTL